MKRKLRLNKAKALELSQRAISANAQALLDKAASDATFQRELDEAAARMIAEAVAREEVEEVVIIAPPVKTLTPKTEDPAKKTWWQELWS